MQIYHVRELNFAKENRTSKIKKQFMKAKVMQTLECILDLHTDKILQLASRICKQRKKKGLYCLNFINLGGSLLLCINNKRYF